MCSGRPVKYHIRYFQASFKLYLLPKRCGGCVPGGGGRGRACLAGQVEAGPGGGGAEEGETRA